ncbi:MAG: asparagine synthase (glutamine-hydrolyzing) [bacterium]|nr:asparagine synthase (glutamine-hydrolyzing) [bacterium]
MCSINGFTWKDEALAKRMNAITAHRGPDSTGIYADNCVTLGHNRLSILDLSALGNQPMQSNDGRFVISFGGEIYNYKELRKELAGYPFKSESDTEVILAGFAKWGEKVFARLQGMFAIALWDSTEKKLLLARDPVGIKPLYYHLDGERLVFASEIKAILEHAHVKRELNPLALNLYLRVNYVPAPLTMFSGIKKLLPGHLLTHHNGKVSFSSFASEDSTTPPRGLGTPPQLRRGGIERLSEELRSRVQGAVKKQLVSDRPVGLYLSGGIDSSAVLEGMSQAQGKVETFSVGFELREGEQAEKFNADFLLARKTAQFFGTSHNEILLSPRDILPLFEEAVYHLDEPISNATIIPQLLLSRFAKNKVTVVLGGDGGDELFGGYERYRLSLLSSYYRTLPAFLRKGVSAVVPKAGKLDTAAGIERFAQFHFLKEKELAPLLASHINQEQQVKDFYDKKFFGKLEKPFETQFMRADRESWLPDESLMRTDKMTMAAGVEARVPLLDLELIAFADSIPLSLKVSPFRTKSILKDAFKGFIPDELLNQPKRGWFSPSAKWLRYPHVAQAARDILSPDYAEATRHLFNWDKVREYLEEHLNGGYHLTSLWAILTLQVWARRFNVKSY